MPVSISASEPSLDSASLRSEHAARALQRDSDDLEQAKCGASDGEPRGNEKVASGARRGLLAHITLIAEIEDARCYGRGTKYVLLFIVVLACFSGPMGTSILYPASPDVARSLNTSESVVNISVGTYILSLGIFPLWWSNFSERHGRRTIYIISFTWFLAFCIGAALAPSIGVLIALRFLSGAGASSVQACGAATVADLYVQEERGFALGLFYLGNLVSIFLAPVIGGAVSEAWGWRATMWVMVIACGLILVLVVFLLPETLRKDDNMTLVMQRLQEQLEGKNEKDPAAIGAVLTRERSIHSMSGADVSIAPERYLTNNSEHSARLQQLAKQASLVESHTSWSTQLYDYLIRPLHSVVLLGYPPALLSIMYSSILFGGMYFFNASLTYGYSRDPYNYSSVVVGLMYIPMSVTYVIASIFGGKWHDKRLKRYAAMHDGDLAGEARISWNCVIGVIGYPISCLIFGWCIHYGEHWVTPLVGTALFGFSYMLLVGVTFTYVVDVLPGKGATGVALNNLVRQVLAAIATFVTVPLTEALGSGVLFSIIAGVISVCGLMLLYLKLRGRQLRQSHNITDFYRRL
ncbi:hypothetical protein CA3LBN_003568 [Candidozyma haemuli]|uniref:Major facilitator superfamily (MFS) profile domain-containing protein n=1 Tax=Candidozyma haemuli TaxID=45357 RepID=A0ABX8I975_9ASCO|nr:hypothetical protein CA3LBN_003568 [[Candida] haemuloni]